MNPEITIRITLGPPAGDIAWAPQVQLGGSALPVPDMVGTGPFTAPDSGTFGALPTPMEGPGTHASGAPAAGLPAPAGVYAPGGWSPSSPMAPNGPLPTPQERFA